MNSYRLGLVSVSFRPHTPEDILKAMQCAGLNYIEWGGDVHVPHGDEKTARVHPAPIAPLPRRHAHRPRHVPDYPISHGAATCMHRLTTWKRSHSCRHSKRNMALLAPPTAAISVSACRRLRNCLWFLQRPKHSEPISFACGQAMREVQLIPGKRKRRFSPNDIRSQKSVTKTM